MYKDGGGFFEVIKGRRGSNKRQKQEWHRFISFSQQSTLVQNEEDGRICIGRVVGGQQRSSGVDLSCRETFLWRRHTLLEVKWGKEGRERKAPAILSITHFTIVNIVDRAGRYIPRRKRLVKKEDRNSNQYITRNTE